MSLAALLWKDVRRELRGKEGLAAGLVLVALFFTLFLWAFPTLQDSPRAAAVAVWLPLVFGAAAIAGRGMASEMDRGTLDWLRSLPVGHGMHGLSRTIVDGALILVLAAVSILLAAALFGVPLSIALAALVLLGAIGLAVVGSLAGGLAAHASAREVLLPILMVPVLAPLLLAGIQGTIALLASGQTDAAQTSALLMLGYDIVAVGIAWLVWPVVMEAD